MYVCVCVPQTITPRKENAQQRKPKLIPRPKGGGSSRVSPAAPMEPPVWAPPSPRVPFSFVRNREWDHPASYRSTLPRPQARKQCSQINCFQTKGRSDGHAPCILHSKECLPLPMSSETYRVFLGSQQKFFLALRCTVQGKHEPVP